SSASLRANSPHMMRYSIHGLLVDSEVPLDSVPINPQDICASSATRISQTDLIESRTDAGEARRYRIVLGEPRRCPYAPPVGRIIAELLEDSRGYWVAESPKGDGYWTIRYADYLDVTVNRGQ